MEQLADITARQLEQHRRIDFARWFAARVETKAIMPGAAGDYYFERWPRTHSADLVRKFMTLETPNIPFYGKAAVAAGTTTDATWAQPIVTPKELTAAFLNIVRPAEIVSQLEGVLRVPVATQIPVWTPTAVSAATWVGQNLMKPVGKLSFTVATLAPGKIQMTVAVTRELLKFAIPGSEQALLDLLAVQIVMGTNEEFILPSRVAGANGNPGSVTNVGTLVTTQNDPVKDAAAVLGALRNARPQARNPTLIMDGTAADALLAAKVEFSAKTIVDPAAGKTIAALDPSAVLLSDSSVEFDTSRHTSLQMDTAPASPSDASTVLVSLFQINAIGLRAERFITWKLTSPAGCQYTTRA